MSARFQAKLYTFGDVERHSIREAADLTASDIYASNVVVRAAKDNVGTAYWGTAGEIGGYLEPREAITFDLSGKFLSLDDIFFLGSIGDKIYVSVFS